VGVNGKDFSSLLGETFLEAIRQAVRQEIKAVLNERVEGNGKDRDQVKAYLSIKEAADLARLSPSTVRLYIRKRQLKAFQVGSRVLVSRTDLEKFLEANPIEANPD
jgi:excisionase family DNA binding protein